MTTNIEKIEKVNNLYECNKLLLKDIFTPEESKILEDEYKISTNKIENIYNFIYAYRKVIKLKFNIPIVDKIYLNNNNNIKIIWGDCLKNLKKMDSECISLVVTSPPYYNARDYSIWKNLKEYLIDMELIIKEIYRVLDNHRVFVFNISDVVGNDGMNKINAFNTRKIPLPAYFIKIFEDCGFTYVDDIIWDKGEVQTSRHKNKSKPWPFYQYCCNCYEHILIFHKHRLEKDIKYPCSECGSLLVRSNSYTYKGLRSWECKNTNCIKTKSNRGKRFSLKTIITNDPINRSNGIIPEDFVSKWRRDIVNISPVIKINNKKENKLGHTAPFPIEIPDMAIQFYSYKNELVLDPFAGSFTTAISAFKLGRIGIGCELRKDMFETCIKNNITSNNCPYEEIDYSSD